MYCLILYGLFTRTYLVLVFTIFCTVCLLFFTAYLLFLYCLFTNFFCSFVYLFLYGLFTYFWVCWCCHDAQYMRGVVGPLLLSTTAMVSPQICNKKKETLSDLQQGKEILSDLQQEKENPVRSATRKRKPCQICNKK